MSRTRKRRRQKTSEVEELFRYLLFLGLIFGSSIMAWFSQRPLAIILVGSGVGVTLLGILVHSVAKYKLRKQAARYRLIAEGNWFNLNPYQFEEYVAEIFEAFGYSTSLTRSSGDGGYDIHIEQNGEVALVECKRYKPSNSVGVKLIREFESVINYNQVDGGYFVTTSRFTQPAIKWARKANTSITLIDGDELARWMQEAEFGPYASKAAQPSKFWTALYRIGRMAMWIGGTMLIIFMVYVAGWYFGTVK